MALLLLENGKRELVIRERAVLIFIFGMSLVDTRSATKDYRSNL
jgi:hypothetical protein